MQDFTAFETTLADRFGGVLLNGKHDPDGQACLLEAAHVSIGEAWSDAPDLWPDLRNLNDAPWSSDALRTTHLMSVLRAYWYWSLWPNEKQVAVMQRVAILTVQFLIAELPALPDDIRTRCRTVSTISEAAWAAWAAWAAARAAEAAGAAGAAAYEKITNKLLELLKQSSQKNQKVITR